jgi:hypothetical protein
MTFHCITLHMPWAFWVLRGWKTIETREHGRFAGLVGKRFGVHVSQKWDTKAFALASRYLTEEQLAITMLLDPEHWFGRIICTAQCDAHRQLTRKDARKALIECRTRRYGNFLSQARETYRIPTRGYQGLWRYCETEGNLYPPAISQAVTANNQQTKSH